MAMTFVGTAVRGGTPMQVVLAEAPVGGARRKSLATVQSTWRSVASSVVLPALAGMAAGMALRARWQSRRAAARSVFRRAKVDAGSAAVAVGASQTSTVPVGQDEAIETIQDVATAGMDVATPHWSTAPTLEKKGKAVPMQKLDWDNVHGLSCVASGVLFLGELVRFVAGQAPSDAECYFAAVVYAVIYATRFKAIRTLPSHFRVTFYATTGWTIYYIAHLLAATDPAAFGHTVYATGIVFLASTIYFYKHWLERMYRHFVEDRFRPYYMPGLLGLMYFHSLDIIDMFNQWLDPKYWDHVIIALPDQAWTIQDVRLTGLFMSSMALFMITLHNKGVLTGGRNTLLTVLGTIFVPALFLTGTHATLQASFP